MAFTRTFTPEAVENIATVIDPTYESHSIPSISPISPVVLPDFIDQSTSPVPPYMPIQGTRRTVAGDSKKKKTKDKCTHQ